MGGEGHEATILMLTTGGSLLRSEAVADSSSERCVVP